jgi:hypothetical protein
VQAKLADKDKDATPSVSLAVQAQVAKKIVCCGCCSIQCEGSVDTKIGFTWGAWTRNILVGRE